MNLRLILLFNELPQVDDICLRVEHVRPEFFIYSCTNEFLVITFNYGYAFISFREPSLAIVFVACIDLLSGPATNDERSAARSGRLTARCFIY